MAGNVIESPAARVERTPRERGEVALGFAVTALVWSAQWQPTLLAPAALIAVAGTFLHRRIWAMRAAPVAARIAVDDGRVVLESSRGREVFRLYDPREGWDTPLDRGAVVALRTAKGALLSFYVRDRHEATNALLRAGIDTTRFPRRFTLDRGPMSRRLWRRALWAIALVTGVALMAILPTVGRPFCLFMLGTFLALRAVALRAPPCATVLAGAVALDTPLLHRRVALRGIVSVEETAGGVSLLAASGRETLLPLATLPPVRREGAQGWRSEAELRDSSLARRAALVAQVRAARAQPDPGDPYRGADGVDVKRAFGVR